MAEGDEVVGVTLGVGELGIGEGAGGPVGALVFFADGEAVFVFEDISEADVGVAEDAGGPHRIEKVIELPAVLGLHEHEVILGGVEDFFLVGVIDNGAEVFDGNIGERVDDEIMVGG